MKRLLFFAVTVFIASILTAEVWVGKLKISQTGELPLELTVTRQDGIYLCSPAQSPAQIPSKTLYKSEDSLSLSFFSIGAKLQLKRESPTTLCGTLHQGGYSFPIQFIPKPAKDSAPKAYTEKEITIHNGSVVLSGTLTLPREMKPDAPLAIMVTGSGKQNRDEEIFGHKPFADIAAYLAERGIATYRYDDRGSYRSTAGLPEDETTKGYATDALAALREMRSLGITSGPTGIIGHSEGGTIAWMLPETDFVVSLAGPTVRGDSILMYQAGQIAGVSEAEMHARRRLLQAVVDGEEVTDSLVHEVDPENITEAAALAKTLNSSRWLREFVCYSPSSDINALNRRNIPVLALFFEKDMQVPSMLNLPTLQRLAPNFTVTVIEGVNHLLLECEDGSPLLYSTLTGTTSDKVLQAIGDFILQL